MKLKIVNSEFTKGVNGEFKLTSADLGIRKDLDNAGKNAAIIHEILESLRAYNSWEFAHWRHEDLEYISDQLGIALNQLGVVIKFPAEITLLED